jgi:two-component system sensor histidine kinase CiaH
MKKKKLRIIITYASVFFIIISLFAVSIFMFVSMNQMQKVDVDLELFKKTVEKRSSSDLSMALPLNPKTVTLVRNEDGTYDHDFPISSFYQEGADLIAEVPLDEYETIRYKGSHYRTLKFRVLINDSQKEFQVLYNIDSDIRVLNSLKSILINGSFFILVACFLISYVLANASIRPMRESIEKERAFLQDASHELRTPIAVIQSRLEGLLRNPEEKIIDKYEYIEPALRESRRISRMVSNLMILTRADAGGTTSKVEQFDLRKLGDDIAIIYSEFASIQNKKFNYTPAEEVIIEGNYENLHQLLIILMDNALKYTKDGGIIDLSISSLKDKGKITVKDNGVGIKEENLEKVFTRFFREDKARNRNNGGTGLGLSIAKWIVDCHGGTITAQRRKEGGTIIEVILPKEHKQKNLKPFVKA